MEKIESVRAALAPLTTAGTIAEVRLGGFASYVGADPPPHTNIVVAVKGENPEQHRAEIDRLISQAGIESVMLRIEPAWGAHKY